MPGPDEYPAPGAGSNIWAAPGQPQAPGQAYPPAPGQPYPQVPGQPYPPAPGQPYPPQHHLAPQLRPVHKPGAVPLRPLRLGDLLDGAVRIVRHNPGATLGASTLVAAVAVLVPLVTTVLFAASTSPGFLDVLASDAGSDAAAYPVTTGDVVGLAVVGLAWVLGLMTQNFGGMLVSGMAAHTTNAAALGGKLSLGQAWAATAGQRLRLLALAFLLTVMVLVGAVLYVGCWVVVVVYTDTVTALVWALVSTPVVVAALAWYWVRLYTLAIPAMAVENLGVNQALGRSLALSRGSFWRILGISLLVMLITQVAAMLLSTPFSVLSVAPLFMGFSEGTASLVSLLVQFVGSMAASALVLPFVGVVASLLHLDLRMRREAYDVELITRSGATAP